MSDIETPTRRRKRRVALEEELESPAHTAEAEAETATAETDINPEADPAAYEAPATPSARERLNGQHAPAAEDEDLNNPDTRQRIAAELDDLIEKIKKARPEFEPPPFSPRRLIEMVKEGLEGLAPELRINVLERLRGAISAEMFDVETWKGIWYVINYTAQFQVDLVKRRFTGEFETDEWGYDREFTDAIRPIFEFLYKYYWRVSVNGMENIPDSGRALLVANHSGQLPFDGAMLGLSVLLEHPAQRLTRTLYATWFPTLPVIADMFTKFGQAMATDDNARRLLEADELVAVFPEGYKGVGKLFKDRYKLARFGRGGFVRTALKTKAPMLPVAIVGAEETYISLAQAPMIAKLIGFPYFPISPTWPWLGPLGLIPLPTKWTIEIGTPIPTDGYEDGAENNLMLVSQLTDQVRNTVQEMLFSRLAQRRSVFFG